MTFTTEMLTWEDLESEKYPIYDIAFPDWNPRDHFDDPYSFEDINHEETQSTHMNVSQTKVKEEDDIPSLLRN